MNKLLSCKDILKKEIVGNKAYNLGLLKSKGYNVPDFFVLPISEKFNEKIIEKIPYEYLSVRSGGIHSFPGLMSSYLNIKKKDSFKYANKVVESSKSKILNEISNYLNKDCSTAVIFQEMISLESIKGSGIISSHHPITGKKEVYLSYIEDKYCSEVVISGGTDLIEETDFNKLKKIINELDDIFKKPQEVEFSILKNNEIIILQSRDLIFSSIKQKSKDKILNENLKIIGRGLGSSSGIIKGKVSFVDNTNDSIYCLKELNPSEISELLNSKAILSKKGDHNCHLAVLCRLLNKPYIVGSDLSEKISKGQEIILDTDEGIIYL